MEQCAEPTPVEVAAVTLDGPLRPEDVAAYLDGRLSGEELERVESVLAESPEARRELVEASRLLATLPVRRSSLRRPMLVAGAAAAAVLALVAIPTILQDRGTERVSAERPARSDDVTGIRKVLPEDGAEVGPTGVRFLWGTVLGATYHLTITDTQGRTIWQTSTADTTLILPETVPLLGPTSYYWNVDALAPDGSSTTTGIHELRVRTK